MAEGTCACGIDGNSAIWLSAEPGRKSWWQRRRGGGAGEGREVAGARWTPGSLAIAVTRVTAEADDGQSVSARSDLSRFLDLIHDVGRLLLAGFMAGIKQASRSWLVYLLGAQIQPRQSNDKSETGLFRDVPAPRPEEGPATTASRKGMALDPQ